ncbi:LamG domain-containing protein [Curtobacterium sp. PhB136]|uniref:LamG domain-containing protein n=1 Tax=Curtobacterium sp. PhB136 TaxID=2485181 RepID=UPI0010CEEC37|nr:LamG domain-containing protein [Curtobacterium sp. PhB136]TCK66155.1 concanavalin A-like lectin/glucanase superfamily protein [Curtobacterium sp. PhB136]
MRGVRLRDGKVVALVLVLALVAVVLLAQFAPTRSAFSAKVTDSSNTAGTAKDFTCSGAIDDDLTGAVFAYKLGEATGAKTAVDWSGKGANGTYQGTMTAATPSPNACPRDPGSSYVLNGGTSFVSTPTAVKNPTTFSEEVWFKTTVAGGLLIGFGSNQVAVSGQHDRQIYLNTSGQLVFGAYNNAVQVVTSPASYNDGAWHHVVSTMSAATGMRLYADGVLVASNTAYTLPENATGYWRVGYDTTTGWPGTANNYSFTGSMRYAAVYSTVLSQTQVTNHYVSSR